MSIEHSSSTHNIDTCYTDYLSLPKDFGAVSSSKLFDFADLNAKSASLVSIEASGQFHAVAGSAYIEAVLTQDFSDHDVDENLACLATAEQHLRAAADVERDKLERGMIHPNDQDHWQRAEMQHDFMDVYRDLACGEVTLRTRNEILERLEYRINYNSYFAGRGSKPAKGFVGELRALRSIWQSHHDSNDPVAFPSTVRGGSGNDRRHETHDIIIAAAPSQSQERLYTAIEVKTGQGLRDQGLVRYDNMIILMGSETIAKVYGAQPLRS